jgi:alpha-ketoglutarate-dependent taurine dioxygenase
MCDYSLHGVANRPAKVGDQLVSTSFSNSFTRGFTEIGEPQLAVCLVPGTELAFEREVEVTHILRRILPRFAFGQTGQRVARFRQVNMERPDTHHDALEFPNGKVVLVTRLCPGQKATVLQLPATANEYGTRKHAGKPEIPGRVPHGVS